MPTANGWLRSVKSGRRRFPTSISPPYRRRYPLRPYALFGRRSKRRKSETVVREEPQIEPPVEEAVVEDAAKPVYHQTVATEPPLWKSVMQHRSFVPVLLGGLLVSIAALAAYMTLPKDFSKRVDKTESDFDAVIERLTKLRKLRKQPSMTERDVLRVRCYLMSLILKDKKRTPFKVTNDALRLLNQSRLSDEEKDVLFETEEMEVPPMPSPPSGPLPDLSGLHVVDPMTELNQVMSTAFGPDASREWWHQLPYVCILRMKKTGAVFMTSIGPREMNAFTLVGFEDPEEAFHSGTMPVQEQRWGLLSKLRDEGMLPSQPSEDEKHFDLTWLHPGEFEALVRKADCYGVVIPAGTLRSNETGKRIPSNDIRTAILKIATDERIGAAKTQKRRLAPLQSSNSVNLKMHRSSTDLAVDDGAQVLSSQSDVLRTIDSQDRTSEAASDETPTADSLESDSDGFEWSSLQNNAVPTNDRHRRPSAHPKKSSPRNLDTFKVNGTAQQSFDSVGQRLHPWWLELPFVVVPMVKLPGTEGGSVEMNISSDPESTDFRSVLFEEEDEAKAFLGVLGRLHGPDTLVAALRVTPQQYLEENTSIEKEEVVVLCTGALLLDKEADKDGLRRAVRMAHVATEIKKGIPSKPQRGASDDFTQRAMQVAEDVIDRFEKRIKDNAVNDNNKRTSDRQDPFTGIMSDLTAAGLEDLFGFEADDENGLEEDDVQHSKLPNDARDETYRQFVAEMTERLDGIQADVQEQDTDPGSDVEKEMELEASLDDLVEEETDQSAHEGDDDSDEDIRVVYPDSVNGEHRTGQQWFTDLDVIFMPQFLTSHGRNTFLAMSDHEDNTLVVGFQDREEALCCKEMMKTWETEGNMAAGIYSMQPQDLIDLCTELDATPVILRRKSVGISLEMTQQEFLSYVAFIAQTQASDYSIFEE